MMLTAMTPDDLIDFLTTWAKADPRVRALVLIGSRARSQHRPNRWSDTDFDVFADDHQSLLADLGWLDEFAPRWLTVIWQGEVMTMFEGGLMAGIEIQSAERIEPRVREFRTLWDPEGLITKAEPGQVRLPDADELGACVAKFWLQVVIAARRLAQGDLFRTVTHFHPIRYFVLEMLEWHARAGGATDTWYDGRFMGEWAEPWAVEALREVAATQDFDSLRTALRHAVRLFERLTQETAQRLGLPRPASVKTDHVEAVVWDWLDRPGWSTTEAGAANRKPEGPRPGPPGE
jgi:hypothetical protein